VLRTAPAEGLLLGFRAEYSVTAQTEPKTKTCFGLPKPRPMPSKMDVNSKIVNPFLFVKYKIVREWYITTPQLKKQH
jgi:hypothetical protein